MSSVQQPTYKRQRYLLSFIQQLGSNVMATDLQKLVFINMMQTGSSEYAFIPYKYGPYSFQLAEDIETLYRNKYIVKEVSGIRSANLEKDAGKYIIANERGDKLIKRAYRTYPYYSINSEILGRLFSEDEKEHFINFRGQYKPSSQMLFTIGYEGKTLESFINELISNGVYVLCDVRKNPISRKFGFSKEKLRHVLENIGIQYVHIPELGIESELRASLATEEDYLALFSDYRNKLQRVTGKISFLYALLTTKKRIALMCYEKEATMCHRHVIRDHLIETYKVECIDL